METITLGIDVAYGMLFGSRSTFNPDSDIPSLEGKVVIVTGGSQQLFTHTDGTC
jgi:hypothetical protein